MWKQPLKWNEQAAKEGTRPRVFCGSMCDVFEDRDELKKWRHRLFQVIYETPNLDWQLLTKRPENFRKLIWDALEGDDEIPEPHILEVADFAEVFPHVWIGTSIENQKTANERITHLLQIPAKVRFLSVEPLLNEIDFLGVLLEQGIDWVIVGGESGPGARPCDIDWIRDIMRQCQAAEVPVFVKQLGANAVEHLRGVRSPASPSTWLGRVQDPKGGDPSEWPEDLQARQFPEVT